MARLTPLSLERTLVLCVLIAGSVFVWDAWRHFRVPIPTQLVLSPDHVLEGRVNVVTLTGQDLRPYLAVRLRGVDVPDDAHGASDVYGALTFRAESPTLAHVTFPAVPVGIYDVDLYNEVERVAVIPSGLTVEAPPRVRVRLKVQARVPPQLVKWLIPRDTDLAGAQLLSASTPYDALDAGVLVDLVVTVPAQQDDSGLLHFNGRTVRLGDTFQFETNDYIWNGQIQEITP